MKKVISLCGKANHAVLYNTLINEYNNNNNNNVMVRLRWENPSRTTKTRFKRICSGCQYI